MAGADGAPQPGAFSSSKHARPTLVAVCVQASREELIKDVEELKGKITGN